MYSNDDVENPCVGSSSSCNSISSPGGSKYWEPVCATEFKPFIGKAFESLKFAFEFYKSYARLCGFDVRKCSQKTHKDGTVISKHYVCSRSGVYKNCDDVDRKKKRMIGRCDCNAKIVVRFSASQGYVIKKFVERHNHELATDEGKQFLKVNRNIDPSHIMFCLNASKVNVGAVKSHSFMKEIAGGFNNVGSTSTDFKNAKRDVKQYVGENDGEMIVRKFMNLKKACEGFSFDYDTDVDGCMTKLFWADPDAIRNFELFGDDCSVDATFRSNK